MPSCVGNEPPARGVELTVTAQFDPETTPVVDPETVPEPEPDPVVPWELTQEAGQRALNRLEVTPEGTVFLFGK